MSSSVPLGGSDQSEVRSAFPLAEVLLGASLFGAACISILLTRVPGGIALFWPGSAIAGAVLVVAFRFVWKPPYPNISIDHAALMTALYGVWFPGVAACLGGLALHLLSGTPWLTGTATVSG